MSRSKWILGSSRKDLALFYIPGLLTVFVTYFFKFNENSVSFLIFTWLCVGLFDAGHVYTSLWRTYLNQAEFSRRRLYYIIAPLVVFLIFFIWMFLKVPYLGAFIAYFTIYHNLRQFYGMGKWYQKLNRSFDSTSDRFLYILCFVAVLIAHFRTDIQWTGYYPNSGVFLYPSDFYTSLFTMVYFLIFGLWVTHEFFKAHRNKKWEFARILSTLYPVLLYAYCFMYATNLSGILFPLIVSHGLSYIVLIGHSVRRINPMVSYFKTIILVFLTAVIFGSLEIFFEEEFAELYSVSVYTIVLTALILTPLFCHYIYDAFLWRSDHPESKKIMDS